MYDAAGLMRTLVLCSRSLAPHKLCDLVTANHLATWEISGQTQDMQLQCLTDLLFCEGFPRAAPLTKPSGMQYLHA